MSYMSEQRCRHCGVHIIYEPMEGHDWWHTLGDDDPFSPYLNCHPTTIAEPRSDPYTSRSV